jgi:hypothetical protein
VVRPPAGNGAVEVEGAAGDRRAAQDGAAWIVEFAAELMNR